MNYESLLHAKRYVNVIDRHLQELTNTPNEVIFQVPFVEQKT